MARSRSGSVLILVVALLVLLALIGTAFITTAGNDRESATQHKYNTQIGLLVQGIQDVTTLAVVNKITPAETTAADSPPDRLTYRPARPHFDATLLSPTPKLPHQTKYMEVDYLIWDGILADRYPSGIQPTPQSAAIGARWQYISASPLARNRDATNPDLYPNQFRSPYVNGTNFPEFYTSRYLVEPIAIPITQANGTTKKYPGFLIRDTNDPANGRRVLAADTDGDGIADAGLFELPTGQIDGVRYYAAVRVIDNAAAINAAVAWEHWRNTESADAQLQGNFTPANIALRSLIEGPLDTDGPDPMSTGNFTRFQNYRQGDLTTSSRTPGRDDGQAPQFQWATKYDAFYFGLGQRLDNPGRNAGSRYRALGVSESAGLAYRFVLANQSGPQTVMESFLTTSTGRGAPAHPITQAVNRKPYEPDQVAQWYNGIFNTGFLAPANRPIRPYVTAYNPVTNVAPAFLNKPGPEVTSEGLTGRPIPAELNTALPTGSGVQEMQRNGRYRYRGTFQNGAYYRPGEWVRHNNKSWVAIRPTTGVSPADTTVAVPHMHRDLSWAEAPWTNQPVKLNPNTANFGTLMAAYWAVMADGPLSKPPANFDPGYGSPIVFTFGDVMRPGHPNANSLPSYYIKQLRAAIAAVNTIDLRDQDEDITSRTVILTDINGGNPVTAHVYGTERQPFITAAMVHITKEDVPYVCIELHNPHPVPVDLAAFKLCYRDRDQGDVIELPTNSLFPTRSIPAFSYLLIENDVSRRPTTNPGTASYDAIAAKVVLPELELLAQGTNLERELLLMRTRRYDGSPTFSSDPANNFRETRTPPLGNRTLNEIDLVCVDQLEFHNIAAGVTNRLRNPIPDPAAPAIPIADRYHYRRSNSGGGSNRWHVVYSGPYNRTPTSPGFPDYERRQRGFVRDRRPDPATPTDELELTAPGWGNKTFENNGLHNDYDKNDPASTPAANPVSTYRTRSLQVNATGMGGPWKGIIQANSGFMRYPPNTTPLGANLPAYPFGGFARNGDILQVTFVGGYKIERNGFFKEINSITIDASFAEDGDLSDDDDNGGSGGNPLEQLGRFCPLYKFSNNNVEYDDFYGRANVGDPMVPINPSGPVPGRPHKYAWAVDIFDYFNVHSPQDDYYPNIDPNPAGDPTLAPPPNQTRKFPGGETGPGATPEPIANKNNSAALLAAGVREDTAANHGLINLNTANEYVISQIPFTNDPLLNQDIATAIVYHRTMVGPLTSLFDLQRIQFPNPTPPLTPIPAKSPQMTPAVIASNIRISDMMYPTIPMRSIDPSLADGDITPYSLNFTTTVDGTDGVAGDFEARYLVLNRVSNMVCFRSDSFTAYILVQGWRNAGTSQPELVAQRRAAMIIDRSTVAPKLTDTWASDVPVTSPTITNVPQN